MASDTLPDDTWVNCFLSTPPRPLLSSLQRRLATSNYHVQALAEIFKERAAIEQEYSARLSKLVKSAEKGDLVKGGPTGEPWDKGSGEAKIWEAILGDIQETSSAHSTLAALLKTDFEVPIRDLPNKIIPWRRIGEQDANLDRTLKDYEKVSSKLDKANTKSGRGGSGKADALASELSQITSSLASLSPMVYTTYQRLDEERLRGLKEVVVRWGTVRADMAAKEGERADRAVAGLIAWETADEVIIVGQRMGGSGGRAGSTAPSLGSTDPSRRMSVATNSANDFAPSTTTRPAPRQNGSFTNMSAANISSGRDKDGENRSGGGGFASGLKSMLGRKSTVINRQRSGSEATSTRSARRPDAFDQISEDVPESVSAPVRSGPSPLIDDEGFSVAPADRHRAPWDEPNDEIATPTLSPTVIGRGAGIAPATTNSFPTTFASPTDVSSDSTLVAQPQQPVSRLNLALTSAPIRETDAEREAAMAKMQQSLTLPSSQPNRRSTIARGRRDVRNTMFGTVNEDGSTSLSGVNTGAGGVSAPSLPDQDEVIASPTEYSGNGVTNEAAQGSSGLPNPTVSRQASQSSIGSRNPFDSPSLGAPPLSPIATTIGSAPSLAGDGLRASINETINVLFKPGGAVSRAQINGEIRLSLTGGITPASSRGLVHIRLTEFEVLEKVAPNPAFLTQVPDKPGEFFLDAEKLAASSGSGTGTVLFRYQVHIPPGAEVHAALLTLNPAFQTRTGETRMILGYHFDSSRGHKITDLVLAAHFTGPDPAVSSVQAKPAGGVWSPNARRMTWKIGSITENDGKVVARFITGDAKEGDAVLTPTNVSATFGLSDVLSGLGIEVLGPEQGGSGASGWQFAEVKKRAVSGKYSAEATLSS